MGIARLALAGLAVLALVALVVIGAFSLFGALRSGTEPVASPTAAATAESSPPGDDRVPTVLVECLRDTCPTVFLKVTGGDVLLDREMVAGEQFRSFDPKVDVVLADAASVRVLANGAARDPGEAGERQEFTVSRED
ncbi:hypothetical protein FHS43_000167 [Streptosporangium becharense]|uniref:DUF4115 domain-containing protein n=1 Tax=Streptosporangium becharense TaxID=1816182 RepID=A0A7W9MH08_9ACTN|nr:hypothetical protein [Streptosporangium becharense]MBB2908921.1 hypothetical protein [Streptosporangium becharense]MBB5820061.1 hypothetical protein [Streptosporangium becharense]